jgi:membrane-associated HD superfamily phosphohydrolase
VLKNKIKDFLSKYLYLDKYYIQYGIIFGLVIVIALLFPKGKSLKYSYQVNDITRSPIIAPFTYPILKSQEKLNLDLEETKRAIPYVFNRNIEIVENQTTAIEEFFLFVGLLRSANSRLEESKKLVYERRYHKQYEKARSEFVSDSTKYAILNSEFRSAYPFVSLKNYWNSYIQVESNFKNSKEIKENKELVTQICRNRWAEGIYDISIQDIFSNDVTIIQGDVPDLASPNSFNDLETAWTKARKELLAISKEEDAFKEIGYDIIVEFMLPNLLYDLQKTERRQIETLSRVPRSHGVVLENELIVDANIRITDEVLSKLNSLSSAVTLQQERSGFYRLFASFLGRIILLSVIVSLFFAFLVVYRVSIFHDWKMVLLISLIFLLQISLANIVVIQLGWSEFLIPVTVGAMS